MPSEPQSIDTLIEHYAKLHNVSPLLMHHIVKNESSYNTNAKGDVNYVCQKTGKIAPSWGLVQINECWWPNESKHATEPDFALNFLATQLSYGKCSLWSTCPVSLPAQ